MNGSMMDFPLTVLHLLERARALFGTVEVVSRRPDKSLVRQTYAETYERCQRLALALQRLGVNAGDRVATLCWNHREHLECYGAIPSMGAVVHTLNLRLHPSELGYIASHGGAVVLVVDRTLWPVFQSFRDLVPSLRHVIVVGDDGGPLPEGALSYEALLAAETPVVHPPGMGAPPGSPFSIRDETAAAMACYTSGTTGNPKGVAYTHRSIVLHTLVAAMGDVTGIGSRDVVMPVVPMFHAAAWGMPYIALATGAKMVMPGPHLDAVSLLDLMVAEKVTAPAGVPTIWLGILSQLDAHRGRWDLSAIRTMLVGGAAAPASLIEGFQDRHGILVTHAWGMTELSPIGTLAAITPSVEARGAEAVRAARASQGIALPFVEVRHRDDEGRVLPWDGETMGELEVRGPWVTASYVDGEGVDSFTPDGWFKTGDVVTLDPDGYMRITDRSKDVVKSGGEWISSVALENALMAHPAVLEAAVFGAPHPRWGERPVAAVVFKAGASASDEELRAHLTTAFARFWIPDAFLVMAQVPRTSTGKFHKRQLRTDHAGVLVDRESPSEPMKKA